MSKFGATNQFPRGRLGPHDEGGLCFGIARDSKGLIHFNFGKKVSWLAMPSEDAITLAKMILSKCGAKKITVEF